MTKTPITTKAAKTKAVKTGAAKDETPPYGTPVEKPKAGALVSKVWEYIKAHKLQNPDDGREIVADDKLRRVFGRDRVTMFEMNKHLAQHLK